MDRYRPLSGQPAVEPGVAVDLASFGERAATIELHNGWLVSATLSDESRALGATAGRIG